MTISDADGEGCGLNTVVRAWLKDDSCSGFVGMGGRHVKEGVYRVLSDTVGCVCVDDTVLDVLMVLLYVEPTHSLAPASQTPHKG